jgi:hypothetical protein
MLALADEPPGTLFGDAPDREGAIRPAKVPAPGVARVLMANRTQVERRPSDLESLLPAGHRARLVWDSVERADLSRMYAGIRAVAGCSGGTAMAPEPLFTLWRYATLDGVGTARELARLTEAHDAYRWLCGGVRVRWPMVASAPPSTPSTPPIPKVRSSLALRRSPSAATWGKWCPWSSKSASGADSTPRHGSLMAAIRP